MLRSCCSIVENYCHHVKYRKGAATITALTWGDVIDIITSAFGITQTRLAEMLHYHKTKITRIKNGEETPTLGVEEIFANVFDPTTPGSAARSSEKAEYHLSVLKDIIESDFKEVFEAMADCWDEKDYKTFVLAMLGRARQGAPSKQQKGVSLDETPSAQMTKLFEQAVADYNIATYICKLPDYLNGESFYAVDAIDFVNTIRTDILGKFVNQQDNGIYKKISEFTLTLETYSVLLGMIRLSVSEIYGGMWKMCGSYDVVFNLLDRDYNKFKTIKENSTSIEESSQNGYSAVDAETHLTQLNFLHSILLAYKQICELYGEICSGRTLLVF